MYRFDSRAAVISHLVIPFENMLPAIKYPFSNLIFEHEFEPPSARPTMWLSLCVL